MGDDAFGRSELARREFTAGFPGASPEDTILAKLVWYRKRGEESDRQWSDILGIIKVQSDRLDVEYLKKWAGALGESDLLDLVLF